VLQEALSKSLPNLRFHYDFAKPPRLYEPRLLLEVPTKNIVTLKLLPLEERWPISRRIHWNAQFVLMICAAPNLKTLHVPAGYQFYPNYGDSSTASPKKMFPPLQELCLEGDWPYGVDDVYRIWDFSKLSVLRLRGIDLAKFTFSVPIYQLSSLTKFEFLFNSDRIPSLHDNPESLVQQLMGIISMIERLEELVLECYHPHKLLPILERHKSTLRVLRLRDLKVHDPQATFEDVENIRTLCPCFKELELNIKIVGNLK
jgi:hypothetical protein